MRRITSTYSEPCLAAELAEEGMKRNDLESWERRVELRRGAFVVADRRRAPSRPYAFVVFTDTFLSRWNPYGGRSLYALACETPEEVQRVLASGRARSDMARGRCVRTLRPDGLPRLDYRDGDHLALADRQRAACWYQENGFRE